MDLAHQKEKKNCMQQAQGLYVVKKKTHNQKRFKPFYTA